MPATPRMQTLSSAVRRRFPDVRSMGVYNPRHIGSKWYNKWSQHAGAEPARGWYGNAWDITSPFWYMMTDVEQRNVRSGHWHQQHPHLPLVVTEHYDYMNRVYAFLHASRERFNINELIWNSPNHFDHLHVSTWPMMANDFWRTHPTKGGPVVTWDRDGTTRNTYYVGEEDEMVIQRGDEGKQVKRIQRWLNRGPTAPEPPLVPDGAFGPLTETEVKRYQARRELDETGVVDGITYGDLTLWKGGD